MSFRFQFRWIPFIAALAAAALGVALGQWQTRRALEKEAIEAKLNARQSEPPVILSGQRLSVEEAEFKRVVVTGEFVPEWTIYLDNRPYQNAAGFYLVTPFRINGSHQHVLVSRGWIKRDVVDRTKIPEIAVPEGKVQIEGVVRRNTGRVLQLGQPDRLRPRLIVQNLEALEFAEASGLPVEPYVIEQISDTKDGLVRDWPRPSLGAEKHRGYAFQWYGLAAMALLFFIITGLKRGSR